VALQGRGLLGHAGAHDEHLCAAVLQHVADLSRQEAVVEWHEHGSEPRAANIVSNVAMSLRPR
jgi:hypothetical protein